MVGINEQSEDPLLKLLTGHVKEFVSDTRFPQSYLEWFACGNLATRLIKESDSGSRDVTAVTSVLFARTGRPLVASVAFYPIYSRNPPISPTEEESRGSSLLSGALGAEEAAEITTRYVLLRHVEEMDLCATVIGQSLRLPDPWNGALAALENIGAYFREFFLQVEFLRRICRCGHCVKSLYPTVFLTKTEFVQAFRMLYWPTSRYNKDQIQRAISDTLSETRFMGELTNSGGSDFPVLLQEFFEVGEDLKALANEAALSYYYRILDKHFEMNERLSILRQRLDSLSHSIGPGFDSPGQDMVQRTSGILATYPTQEADLLPGGLIAHYLGVYL